jgi:hypothetical protein
LPADLNPTQAAQEKLQNLPFAVPGLGDGDLACSNGLDIFGDQIEVPVIEKRRGGLDDVPCLADIVAEAFLTRPFGAVVVASGLQGLAGMRKAPQPSCLYGFVTPQK